MRLQQFSFVKSFAKRAINKLYLEQLQQDSLNQLILTQIEEVQYICNTLNFLWFYCVYITLPKLQSGCLGQPR